MKKILIVDDELDIIDLVRNRLVVNGYEVVSATDGKMGVKMAQTECPDLVLMDVMMPNMQGGDAVRLLKSNYKTKDIPIIFLTAVTNSKKPVGEEGVGINVAGVNYPAIGKPFESERLLMEIKKNLSI